MATVSVIYPAGEGARFDYDYYARIHLPLLRERWGEAGLVAADAWRGMAGGDGGEPGFLAIALLRFASAEQIGAAMSGEHAAEIIGDVANFTNVQPLLQVNEAMA